MVTVKTTSCIPNNLREYKKKIFRIIREKTKKRKDRFLKKILWYVDRCYFIISPEGNQFVAVTRESIWTLIAENLYAHVACVTSEITNFHWRYNKTRLSRLISVKFETNLKMDIETYKIFIAYLYLVKQLSIQHEQASWTWSLIL